MVWMSFVSKKKLCKSLINKGFIVEQGRIELRSKQAMKTPSTYFFRIMPDNAQHVYIAIGLIVKTSWHYFLIILKNNLLN